MRSRMDPVSTIAELQRLRMKDGGPLRTTFFSNGRFQHLAAADGRLVAARLLTRVSLHNAPVSGVRESLSNSLLRAMKYRVTKIDAASDQLDWAIKLFLDHEAYVPAITLAGAAEEIAGEAIGKDSAFRELLVRLSEKSGLSEPEVSQLHLNRAKNWLKHWKKLKDEEVIEIELEKEAVQYLIRAILNLAVYDRSLSSETPRFLNWLGEWEEDLNDDS